MANVRATITDADGTVLTQADARRPAFLRRQRDIAAAAAAADAGAAVGYARDGAEYVAPIVVNDQRLGTLPHVRQQRRHRLAGRRHRQHSWRPSSGWRPSRCGSWPGSWAGPGTAGRRPSQFMHLMANAVARLCYQEFQLRQRIEELTAVTHLSA